MAAEQPFTAGTSPVNLVAGLSLTDGTEYVVQNTGTVPVLYTESPITPNTEPAIPASISWPNVVVDRGEVVDVPDFIPHNTGGGEPFSVLGDLHGLSVDRSGDLTGTVDADAPFGTTEVLVSAATSNITIRLTIRRPAISWLIVQPGDHFTFEALASDPLWVRATTGTARLSTNAI